MKKVKKPVWIVILCVCVAALAGVGFYLFRYYSQQDISRADLTPTAPTESAATEAATTAEVQESTMNNQGFEMKPLDIEDIDFDELMQINSDVYAWIYIPGTKVDYPVARAASTGDDSFYLEHNIYRQYQFSGTIYSELKNQPELHDRVTVLYGHNMLNGSMFRTLHDFRDPDFFAANPYIYVYLPDRTLKYEIFAAYEYDDRHILYSFDFSDKDVYAEYLAYATNPTESMMYNRREVEVTTDDKIITLSTCLGNIDTSRYLVQGVLISDEPARASE